MHIAVNTRMLLAGKMEGIGYFTYETMRRITNNHPEHQFTFIFDRPFDERFVFTENISPVVVNPPARHPVLWYLWHEWGLPPLLKKIKPDLFIGTDGYLSLSSNVKSLAVIHDLNFEAYPDDLPFFNRIYYRHYFPLFSKKASRIAAVSEFTKRDLMIRYGTDENKIDVVYNGVNSDFTPVDAATIAKTREKFSHGKPYFVFVGAIHQRKNIANLLRAFEQFKNSKQSPLKLLLTGKKRWWTDEMEKTYNAMKHRDDVIFTGRLDENDLKLVTASAFASVYVSTFEGFGIPIVEAMRCGVPVITSNVTSMPEVAGNAALLCDPFSPESIAEAMLEIYSDEKLRTSLIEKGLKRQLDFSWDLTALKLWDSVEKSLFNTVTQRYRDAQR
jgi:glycosyltransferase involved in cell wall biosynthesis